MARRSSGRRPQGAGKRAGGPWYGDEGLRAVFERGARQLHPTLQRKFVHDGEDAGLHYTVLLEVPGYATREVELRFPAGWSATAVRIHVDGPDDSPHRYDTGALCVWYPNDPRDRRWERRDGLAQLLDMIAVHLFKEAWWRESGEWLGDEAPHDQTEKNHLPRRLRRGR